MVLEAHRGNYPFLAMDSVSDGRNVSVEVGDTVDIRNVPWNETVDNGKYYKHERKAIVEEST